MCSWFSKQLKLKQQGSWQHAVFIIILFRSSQTWCIFSIHCSASAQPKDFKDAFKAALKLCLSRFKKSATSASFERWHPLKWKAQTLDFWHSQATKPCQSNIPHHVPSPPTSSMPNGGTPLFESRYTVTGAISNKRRTSGRSPSFAAFCIIICIPQWQNRRKVVQWYSVLPCK